MTRPLCGVALALLASAWAPTSAAAQNPTRSWFLIVSGSSGEPRFAQEFERLGASFRSAATTRFGTPDSMAIWLAEDPAKDPHIAARSTRGAIDSAFRRIAFEARAGDRVFVLLLGHGSSQGNVSRFNIPGPDLTAADFGGFLDRLAAQSVVFVDATSASGDFVKAVSGKNRIVITATKSGMEGNETIFARYFVQAWTDDVADTDKDGRVSVLEAFVYARREVARAYEQGGKLLTEHAVLDDDGDGVARADASARGPDGLRARSFYLAAPMGLTAAAASDPATAGLLATRGRLEASIDSLRARKSSMPEAQYQSALEGLLVKLAEVNKAIREGGARKP